MPEDTSVENVLECLKKTAKGQLNYDRHWNETKEGRERVLEEITSHLGKLDVGPNDEPEDSQTDSTHPQSQRDMEALTPIMCPEKHTPRYFGLKPVVINVNRSAERSLRKDRIVIDSPSQESKVTKFHLADNEQTLYNYDTPGILKKIAATNVFVRLKKLDISMTGVSLNGLDTNTIVGSPVSLDPPTPQDEDEDTESDGEGDESNVDQKILYLKEVAKREAAKRISERQRMFDEKSKELEDIARNNARNEFEQFKKEFFEAEERILREVEKKRAEDIAEIDRIKTNSENRLKHLESLADRARELDKQQLQLDLLETTKQELETQLDEFSLLWNSIDEEELSDNSKKLSQVPGFVFAALQDLSGKCSNGSASQEDWDFVQQLGRLISDGCGILQKDIEDIEKKRAEKLAAEEAFKQQSEKTVQLEEPAHDPTPPPPCEPNPPSQEHPDPPPEVVPPSEISKPDVPVTSSLIAPSSQGHSSDQLAFYHSVMEFKNSYIAGVTTDPTFDKKLKNDLLTAVNTPLNAVSAQTRQHLRDKLARLTQLLSGQPVRIKDSDVSALHHANGIKYCTAMLAKKMARQGKDVISSKFEAAFPFAGVSIALWIQFPDFGRLLLAYLYEFCPFLVPYHPVRVEGQSDKDYYLQLGYQYEGDAVERQDKYLKRMDGLASLYAALAVSSIPYNSGPEVTHPFGPVHLWQYLARCCCMEPFPDVTATVILQVLRVAGNLMFAKYGSQFLKLLITIKTHLLPKLENVKTDGGPTSRLESFLITAIRTKSIKAPEGKLAPGFIQ